MPITSRCFFYPFIPALLVVSMTACNGQRNADKKNASGDSSLVLPLQQTVSIQEQERIRTACQAWYDTTLAPKGFNGAMLVAKNGHIVFEKSSGATRLPGTDSMDANTPLHIASVSKTFTAMAVLKLHQDGKLNTDDEFSRFFPAFNYPGVTIRSLLNHRSGLPNYTYFMDKMGWDKTKSVSNEDVLDFLINRKAELSDISPPDTRFAYCNTNYALLALLIEKISGMSYAAFMQQTFFTPLQMKNSFVYSPADSNRIIPSYNWKGIKEPLTFLDRVYGDKNIYSSLSDLLRWDRALYGNRLFSSQTLTQAYSPYSNEKPGIRNYGLGWRMLNFPNGKQIVYHNGWWHGNNATFIRLINDTATIIVIGNKFTRAIYKARMLASVFNNYYGAGEEEENDQSFTPNTATVSTTPVSGINTKSKAFRQKK